MTSPESAKIKQNLCTCQNIIYLIQIKKTALRYEYKNRYIIQRALRIANNIPSLPSLLQ